MQAQVYAQSQPQMRPTLSRLVRLAATPAGPGCIGNVYCLLLQDLPAAQLDDPSASGLWVKGNYRAQLEVWWSRDGRGLMLLDWDYRANVLGCGDWPCGTSDLYVHRYVSGQVRDEKFWRIGVPYRGQPWTEVKPGLPAAVRADASVRVQAFRQASGVQGELWLDVQLPEQGTELRVFVEADGARVPIYRLRWDAVRGVFVPARL
ncbi:hypothetical protein GCM10017783_18550 [Deinococcus piscis]|uniref:Uncharacterized protein n=1 Tax=Deinococcus piscis TaxID=394230 RepID=A0ABQ3KBI5_9DEIO|nr:hypothetical protein GCM10017783_18550 [Deinococcus piscis]